MQYNNKTQMLAECVYRVYNVNTERFLELKVAHTHSGRTLLHFWIIEFE